MDGKIIAKIVEQCLKKLDVQTKDSALAEELRKVLSQVLGQLDLVNRDDFDAQKLLLERTTQLVEQLEEKINQLEQKS